MSVVVVYRDGSSETFTEVTHFDATGPTSVEITGTDSSGVSASWWIPWEIIKKVGQILK
ncbi:MAG: hypothetical protein IPK64_19830 [bacterium]|nr:hypothetical protein [bacterium]